MRRRLCANNSSELNRLPFAFVCGQMNGFRCTFFAALYASHIGSAPAVRLSDVSMSQLPADLRDEDDFFSGSLPRGGVPTRSPSHQQPRSFNRVTLARPKARVSISPRGRQRDSAWNERVTARSV
jgi:hypothetical protein